MKRRYQIFQFYVAIIKQRIKTRKLETKLIEKENFAIFY